MHISVALFSEFISALYRLILVNALFDRVTYWLMKTLVA
jgi:hypothetical protein